MAGPVSLFQLTLRGRWGEHLLPRALTITRDPVRGIERLPPRVRAEQGLPWRVREEIGPRGTRGRVGGGRGCDLSPVYAAPRTINRAGGRIGQCRGRASNPGDP